MDEKKLWARAVRQIRGYSKTDMARDLVIAAFAKLFDEPGSGFDAKAFRATCARGQEARCSNHACYTKGQTIVRDTATDPKCPYCGQQTLEYREEDWP